MADLTEYEVELGGVKTTVQLSSDDVKRHKAAGVDLKEATKPANKARPVANKEA